MTETQDERFMRIALKEAEEALRKDEVPVGCVIVGSEGELLGKAHNMRETLQDPTAHAEILAITQAAEALGSWRLVGATLYVTLEPCPMCAGAAVNARIKRVVYGAADPKAGAARTLFKILDDPRLNHRCEAAEGVLEFECAAILSSFFQKKRQSNAKTGE
jgi:tRNA(adenine34) deaminase